MPGKFICSLNFSLYILDPLMLRIEYFGEKLAVAQCAAFVILGKMAALSSWGKQKWLYDPCRPTRNENATERKACMSHRVIPHDQTPTKEHHG